MKAPAATERDPPGKRCLSPGISRGQRVGEMPTVRGADGLSRRSSAAFLREISTEYMGAALLLPALSPASSQHEQQSSAWSMFL